MTRRANGTSKKAAEYPQDPHAWYRESPADVEVLFDHVDFRDSLIWDPCCGVGNILDVARARGHATVGSDIVQRGSRHPFFRGNFLQTTRSPSGQGRPLSLISNPPYNEPVGIAEAIILHTLNTVPFYRAAFLVPIEFACGQGRYERLYSKHRPSHVGFIVKRPSMPPGTAVEQLGDDAFKGGMQEYIWLIYQEGGPHRTEALFLAPSRLATTPSDRRIRRGSHSPSASA